MNLPAWLHAAGGDVIIAVHAQPGAKRSEVVGAHGDALKVRVASPPVDGKANAALLEFLAAQLGVPKRDLELVSGQTARAKRVRISGLHADEALRRLAPPA